MILKKLLQSNENDISRTEKTVALTIASMVSTLLSMLLSMMAARLLTKTEIAINSQTFLAYSTFSPFLTWGINSSIYYYLSKNEHRKRAAVNECLTPVLGASILFSIFILLGGNQLLSQWFKNPAIAETLYFIVPYILLVTPASILTYVFVYENRLRFNAVFTTVQTIATLIVVMAVMFYFRTGQSMVISRSIVGSLFAVITFYLAYMILPKEEGRISWDNIKKLLAISLPLGISCVMGTLDRNLDQWIVSMMLTPEVYAVYTQGARELPLISTITGAISTVIIVDLTKSVQKKDYESAKELFRKAAEKTALFLMPAMVFFFVAAKPLIIFLYTEEFIEAVPIFQIYLLYMPIRIVYYTPFLVALGKSKFIMWEGVFALFVNAALSIICVHFFSAKGAALATILSLYLVNVPLNIYMISKGTQIPWRQLLPFKHIFLCIIYAIPGAICSLLLGQIMEDHFSSFVILISEFFMFVVVTFPILSWRFDISGRNIATKVFNRIRSYF